MIPNQYVDTNKYLLTIIYKLQAFRLDVNVGAEKPQLIFARHNTQIVNNPVKRRKLVPGVS